MEKCKILETKNIDMFCRGIIKKTKGLAVSQNRTLVVSSITGASVGLVSGLSRSDIKGKKYLSSARENYVNEAMQKHFDNVVLSYKTVPKRANAFNRIRKEALSNFENSAVFQQAKKNITSMKLKESALYAAIGCAVGALGSMIAHFINSKNSDKEE